MNASEHKKLENFCKERCQRHLGWNAKRRHDCREETMCPQCKSLSEKNSIESAFILVNKQRDILMSALLAIKENGARRENKRGNEFWCQAQAIDAIAEYNKAAME